MVTYVSIRWVDTSLKSKQGTDALNMELQCLEMRVVKLWRLHSDSNTDKDLQRQNEPLAAWHDWPLDLLPHWYWQHCVTYTQATNNNLTAVWYCFDPWGVVPSFWGGVSPSRLRITTPFKVEGIWCTQGTLPYLTSLPFIWKKWNLISRFPRGWILRIRVCWLNFSVVHPSGENFYLFSKILLNGLAWKL